MTSSKTSFSKLRATFFLVAAPATTACLFVPWQTEQTDRESLWGASEASVSGLSAAGVPLVIAVLAILAAGVLATVGPRRLNVAAGAGGTLGGVALLAVAVAELGAVGEDRFAVTTATAVGTYAAIAVGGIVAIVFLISAVVSARRSARAVPAVTVGT